MPLRMGLRMVLLTRSCQTLPIFPAQSAILKRSRIRGVSVVQRRNPTSRAANSSSLGGEHESRWAEQIRCTVLTVSLQTQVIRRHHCGKRMDTPPLQHIFDRMTRSGDWLREKMQNPTLTPRLGVYTGPAVAKAAAITIPGAESAATALAGPRTDRLLSARVDGLLGRSAFLPSNLIEFPIADRL